jgi:transcriptional regulator with XRE-family HTH domain
VICYAVHLDAEDEVNRVRTARLLRHKIAAYGEGMPVVVAGAFHCGAESFPYRHLVDEGPLVDALTTDATRTERILLSHGHPVHRARPGRAEVTVRARDEVLRDRTWTEVGATVVARRRRGASGITLRRMVRVPLTPADRERGERLGVLLREARGERSLTDVATAAGISAETLRKIETGRIPTPAFFTVSALATALGLSLDTLAVTTTRSTVP